jgi:uncharacterized membrane protein (DUF441 family)
MKGLIFIFFLMILGILVNSRIVLISSFILLVLKLMKQDNIFVLLSNKGIELGLIFLLLAVLSPLLITPPDWMELINSLKSWEGIIAIIAGLLATQFNEMGLILLNEFPQIIIGIILGSLIGIIFMDGIPVGPLMAAGIAAILIRLLKFFQYNLGA